MMEVITIVVCLIKKLVFVIFDRRNHARFAPVAEETYSPPVNPEIEALKNKKVEI